MTITKARNSGHSTCFLFLLILLFAHHAAAQNAPPVVPDPPGNYSFGPTINKNMAIVLVLLVCVFFVLGFLSVYTRQCSENSFLTDLDIPGVSNGRSRRAAAAARGLDDEVISTFPTFEYSTVKGLKIGKSTLECAVCLNEFADDDTLRFIPKCSHVFHCDCIDAWLASHSTCPVCRANLIPKPGDPSFPVIRISDPESGPDEPEPRLESIHVANDIHGRDAQIRDENLKNPSPINNQNRPPRSRSTGWRLNALFPRSHSTGHSLVQAGESDERFTLRLPEEVRSQLLSSTGGLSRTRSCVAFPRAQSSRQGYRSGSGRRKNLVTAERTDRRSKSDRWTFLLGTPLFGRSGSSRSQKGGGGGGDQDAGEHPFVRFRPDNSGQV